ncbi:AbrB/MazE/SpoVT family DNA-binding domain-containing protein [Thermaerobacter composti]|uniref:AbrB/MazE/SpoVT family DNA-binding domain-containing protein n=1 Tax=Thermaerobacter composti TaxID=554949 RepID=A0ABZ0QTN3_9FIRM|nr:AbrB/MazE/SpoVT family DNA-binding domain-containing protein [Thermaerobacter composti]PZN06714.1 MAG: hypothetical protein DIU76_06355 [Bacillota bacterium]WPD20199.1 AbrB/MazE/SpoVT family DNA-binding domain-containing protein [Thermaerobacter composti]
MRATGIVRRIDELGRLVLPAQLRRNLGITPGSYVAFAVDEGGSIILQPVQDATLDPKIRAIEYALNAIDEVLAEPNLDVDWHDVRNVLAEAIGEVPLRGRG